MFRNAFAVLFSLFCLSTSAVAAEIKIPAFDAAKHFYPVNSTWKSFLNDAQIAAINQKLVELNEPAYFIEYSAGPRSQYEAEWFRGKVLAQWKKRGFNDAEWSLVIVGHHPDTVVYSVPSTLGKNFRPVSDTSATTSQAKGIAYLVEMAGSVASKKAEVQAEKDRVVAEALSKTLREIRDREEAQARFDAASMLLTEEETLVSQLLFHEPLRHDESTALLDALKKVDRGNMLDVLESCTHVLSHVTAVRKESEEKSKRLTVNLLGIFGVLMFLGIIAFGLFKAHRAINRGKKFHQNLGVLHDRLDGYLLKRLEIEEYTGVTKKKINELLGRISDFMTVSLVRPEDIEAQLDVLNEIEKMETGIRECEGDFETDLHGMCDHSIYLYLLSNDRDIKLLNMTRKSDPLSYSHELFRKVRQDYTSIARLIKTLGNDAVDLALSEVKWQSFSRQDVVIYLGGLALKKEKPSQSRPR